MLQMRLAYCNKLCQLRVTTFLQPFFIDALQLTHTFACSKGTWLGKLRGNFDYSRYLGSIAPTKHRFN